MNLLGLTDMILRIDRLVRAAMWFEDMMRWWNNARWVDLGKRPCGGDIVQRCAVVLFVVVQNR